MALIEPDPRSRYRLHQVRGVLVPQVGTLSAPRVRGPAPRDDVDAPLARHPTLTWKQRHPGHHSVQDHASKTMSGSGVATSTSLSNRSSITLRCMVPLLTEDLSPRAGNDTRGHRR